jgi:hypothetical protein
MTRRLRLRKWLRERKERGDDGLTGAEEGCAEFERWELKLEMEGETALGYVG